MFKNKKFLYSNFKTKVFKVGMICMTILINAISLILYTDPQN